MGAHGLFGEGSGGSAEVGRRRASDMSKKRAGAKRAARLKVAARACSSTPPPTNMDSSSVAIPSSTPSRSTGGWLTAWERSMVGLASLESARAAIRSWSRITARSASRTTMRGPLPPAALASGAPSPSPMNTSGLSFSAMLRAMTLKHCTLRSMRTRAFEPDLVRR